MWRQKIALGVIAGAALIIWLTQLQAETPKAAPEFSSTTIDLGVLVSDVEKSAKFYTEAIGFKEVKGFEVPGDFAKESGLTNGKGFKVRVFVLGDSASATKLKLIEMADEKPAKNNTEFVPSEFGFRYLTLFINSTETAVARLKKAGVKPIAKGPVTLPKNLDEKLALTIVRDPDGNLVELVGPK